jgi:hypothetical protein
MAEFEDFIPAPRDAVEAGFFVPPSAEVVREERLSRIAAHAMLTPDDSRSYEPHRHGVAYAALVVVAGVIRVLNRG